MSAIATRPSLPAPLSSIPTKKCRSRKRRLDRRAAEREARNSSLTQDERWANQRTAVPAGATQPLSETSDPTSVRRTAVYPPSRNVGDSPTNENSPFQIGLESSENLGLYKPAVPDQQQDTLTRTFRANSSGSGPSSPTRTFRANSSGSGPGQELCIHCSRVEDAQIHTSLWMPPFQSQPPFSVQTYHILEALSSPRSLLQPADELLGSLPGSADETTQLRYFAQPNAHLHGGIGVTSKSLFYKQSM